MHHLGEAQVLGAELNRGVNVADDVPDADRGRRRTAQS
jgi:hypothetical protein